MFEEIDWFVFTISATVIYGLINFMYKVVAEYKLPSHKIVHTSAATISVLSFLIIIITQSEFVNWTHILFFALINSTFFGFGSIMKIQSLKNIPSSLAFPVTKMNSAFLIIYALILFDEKPAPLQWLGIAVSFSILAYISFDLQKTKQIDIDKRRQWIGLGFALLAAFSTSISMLTGKFASTEVPKLNYIFMSYTLVMIYTFIINKTMFKSREALSKTDKRKVLKFGVLIGMLNFGGYFLVLSAFATGPLSLIQGISSNSFIIPVVLAIIVYKEKFTYKNAIVVALAILSVLLIKLS